MNGKNRELVLRTSGYAENGEFVQDISGNYVQSVEMKDLNADGNMEVYFFLTSKGKDNSGSIIAYTSADGKSVSRIAIPDLKENPELSEGYRGSDCFTFEDRYLVREFPIYYEKQPDAQAPGTRTIRYELVADGEALNFKVVDSF